MKKTKLTEEQIAFALKQTDTGTSVDELCRKVGICQVTLPVAQKIRRPWRV